MIVNIGSSKACGQNKDKSSIHAEELAIQYLRNMNNLNRYIIYIYRYSKDGYFKPAFCCQRCSKLINKYHLQNKIFTINQSLNIINSYDDMIQVILKMIENKYMFTFDKNLLRSIMEDLTYMYNPNDEINKDRIIELLEDTDTDEEDEGDGVPIIDGNQ